MSGPKYFTIPKSYSLSVFDGRLNEIFCLQSDISQLFREIENYAIKACILSSLTVMVLH